MNPRRTRIVKQGREGTGPVLYWMHRDHRVRDNWSLLGAAARAAGLGRPLCVVHCLDPSYPMAAPSHFRFLIEGLKEVSRTLAGLGMGFVQLLGDPPIRVAALAREIDAACLVTDFDPLRHKRAWLARTCEAVPCPVLETDARNVVPCFVASDKAEYMARTIRPKIHRLLPEFLEDFPALPGPSGRFRAAPGGSLADMLGTDASTAGHHGWDAVERAMPEAARAPLLALFSPGEDAARAALEHFISRGLAGYAKNRNDPSLDGQSGLSPWLHFGMVPAQRAALAAMASTAPSEDKEAFLEELIVRRELSDNFCLHHQEYDSTACYPDWAKKTLASHAADPRPWLYARASLEAGETHDPAWNAAQREMLATGKMHGYMRMYWGKKLLEWTTCVEEAQETAVALNDRHSLDGRDPNGYAGVAWCLGGVHDRPWVERPVFGQIRCMTLSGLSRKFDVEAYIRKVDALPQSAGAK